jgi:aerobic carbon-monoxide dehydrogenase large subunit
MDYALPTAETMPPLVVEHMPKPSPHTPGGFKGMAEGGTIGAPAAIANAVADGLRGAGVDQSAIDFYPLTASRLFALISEGP